MGGQLTFEFMEGQIREEIGRELLVYFAEQANGCVELAGSFGHGLALDPRVQLDRASNTAAYYAYRTAAETVARVCNVPLVIE